jgi:hypothetical protein
MAGKENNMRYLAVIVIGLILGGALVSLFLAYPEDKPVVETENIEAQLGDFPEDDKLSAGLREAFIDGCATETNKSDCVCMFNYLDSHLTNKQFINLSIRVSEGEMPDIFFDAALDCTQ